MAEIKIGGRMSVGNVKYQIHNGLGRFPEAAVDNATFACTDVAPEGYLTGDEFERRCIANITKFYHEQGIL